MSLLAKPMACQFFCRIALATKPSLTLLPILACWFMSAMASYRPRIRRGNCDVQPRVKASSLGLERSVSEVNLRRVGPKMHGIHGVYSKITFQLLISSLISMSTINIKIKINLISLKSVALRPGQSRRASDPITSARGDP
jgi:hypothetical protein